MVRKMTPAQYKAAVQKAQRDQKRAVDNYNREVRKHNAAVKKGSDDYNREVRNYNTKVRAHNRQVESQRRRVKQEIARLRSRPTATTFASYRTTTTTFVETFTAVDTRLASHSGSHTDQHLLDLASDEAANSVYLLNALDGDGATDEDPSEEELRAPSMASELATFGPDLVQRWTGVLYALSPHNPDAARHFCTSAREVLITMIDSSAPDADVKHADPTCEVTDRGSPTRKAKIRHLMRRQGVMADDMADVVEQDMINVLSLFRTFNDGTHGHAGRFSITELSAMRTRVESAIGFIHQVIVGTAA